MATLLFAANGTIEAQTTAPQVLGRDALRNIVQEQCVPHWLAAQAPQPCVSVHLAADETLADGFAVLHDRKGGAHYLLIPTQPISGIESPLLLQPGTPSYFAAAWQARDVLALDLGKVPRRDAIAMAVNHIQARSQDQLHIHLSCLSPPVHDLLQAELPRLGSAWSSLTLNERPYAARRVGASLLGTDDPFKLLADHLDGTTEAMGEYTLLVAGMTFADGPGYIVVAGTAVPGAERLLDATCAVAR